MDEYKINLKQIKLDTKSAFSELLEVAKLKSYEAVVVGGSTSEIVGKNIGSSTNIEVGKAILNGLIPTAKQNNVFIVVQSCEHINRALVVEEEYAIRNNLEIVNVIPVENAGGGFATAAMELFHKPVVVEKVGVQGGMDIGDVFIGMHLRGVGVVVRSKIKKIGKANLSMIRTRPRQIGGERSKHYKL
ncbi:MAG TPA: TIGR01440 family protein [Tissierellales bacterium]|nr:TIGR01440 family protein [Tissierellales bacterium]